MMKLRAGEKYLVTCDGWFYAPDGKKYKAVHGTCNGIENAEQVLGIKTNARSTNWYVIIGNMVIAGCQIHYVIQTDDYYQYDVTENCYGDGGMSKFTRMSEIFDADSWGGA